MSNSANVFITYRKYFAVLGGFLLNLSIGNLYSYNNMAPYLVEYMKNHSLSNTSVNYGNTAWIFSMGIFGMGSSITLGEVMVQKMGPSLTVLFAGWLMSLTVLLMAYTLTTYLAVVVVTYGLINGIATGIVYGVTINVGCNWFPNRKGTTAGLIVAGFGLSAFVFDIVQSAYIIAADQNITKITEAQLLKVPQSYMLLGCIFLLLQFCGAMLLKNPPHEELDNTTSKFTSDLFGIRECQDGLINIRPHKLFMELDFWVLWITYSLLSACFGIIISLHKSFGMILNIPDGESFQLTYASSLGSLCNCLGRLFWGLIIDRFRYKVVMLILTILLAVFLATFYVPFWIPHSEMPVSKGITAMYFIWVMLLYFIPSGIFAIFPYVCSQLFGQQNFIANYGLLFTAYSLGGLITSSITTYIWSNKGKEPNLYLQSFMSATVMAILAALLTLFYRGKSLIRNSSYI